MAGKAPVDAVQDMKIDLLVLLRTNWAGPSFDLEELVWGNSPAETDVWLHCGAVHQQLSLEGNLDLDLACMALALVALDSMLKHCRIGSARGVVMCGRSAGV